MDAHSKRWVDYPSIIFLFIAFWAMSARLTATQWIDELSKLEYSVLLGIMLGFFFRY